MIFGNELSEFSRLTVGCAAGDLPVKLQDPVMVLTVILYTF